MNKAWSIFINFAIFLITLLVVWLVYRFTKSSQSDLKSDIESTVNAKNLLEYP